MSRGAVFHPPREWAARPAVLSSGEAHSYGELDARSRRMARQLLAQAATPDLGGARVGFLMAPGAEYVVTQWAVWRAGGIAVPLCPDHPERELAYAIDDADCSALVGAGATGRCLEGLARERGIPSRPTADVVIFARSADKGAVAATPMQLMFTPENWKKPQMITVTATDDDVVNPGQRTVVVSHTSWSEDPDYHEISVDSVAVTIIDNEGSGGPITPPGPGPAIIPPNNPAPPPATDPGDDPRDQPPVDGPGVDPVNPPDDPPGKDPVKPIGPPANDPDAPADPPHDGPIDDPPADDPGDEPAPPPPEDRPEDKPGDSPPDGPGVDPVGPPVEGD